MELCMEQNTSTLVMPENYAVVAEEEMMYLDGGAKRYVGYINANTCSRMAAYAAIGAGIVGIIGGSATIVSAVATILSCGGAAAALAISAGITVVAGGGLAVLSGYLWLASTYKGLNIYVDPKSAIPVSCSIRK